MTNASPSDVGVYRPIVKIAGVALAPDVEQNLFDTRVRLVANGVSEATLRFYDADFKLLDQAMKIGNPVEVAFPSGDQEQQDPKIVFKGEIMELAAEQGPTDLHELVVTAFDKAHRLTHTFAPTSYVNVTYGDIIKKIAVAVGLRATVSGALTQIKVKHLYQAIDHASLLDEIALRSGATWRVVGDELVVDATAPQPVPVKWGENLLRFSTRLNGAGATKSVEARGWDFTTKKAIVARASSPSQGLSNAGLSPQIGSLPFTGARLAGQHVLASQDEATLVAKSLRARADSALTQARGEVHGDPSLVPGGSVKVEQMGTAFSGTYRLTSVEHVCTRGLGYLTRFVAGPTSASTLADLVGGTRKMQGPMIGIVTNNKDSELNLGRVKVKFPELTEDFESDWARVVSIGGGSSRGFQVIPAVGDEVLVMFEHDDIRRPIVVGGLWNGHDSMPRELGKVVNSGKTTAWHVQTASGHTLTFDDSEANKENVKLMMSDGKTLLYLGKDQVQLWANGTPLEIKTGGSSIVMKESQIDITSTNINLKAQANVKIEASASLQAKGNGSAQLEGGAVTVKGSGVANVEASGPVTIKGAIVKIN